MVAVSSRKSLICSKADRILGATAVAVAAATGAGMVGTESQADADVVYFLNVNINIPSNIDGVYLNVVNGLTGTSGGTTAGYDVNPYSATTMNFFSPGGVNHGFAQAIGGGGTASLAYGTLVDASRTYTNGAASVTNEPWVLNANNLVGFRFLNENTGLLHYGWMEIDISTALNAQPRQIRSYAYESTPGLGITAVPEPTTFGFLAAGAVGLMAARRRRVA